MKQFFYFFIIFIFSLIFFSYRLLEVPRGITIDEAAFGYNGSLISQTLRDENNRFLPVFVLSLDSRDWRQPITQYFQVIYFKIFGRSLFNLKFTSVIVASFCAALIFLLGAKIKDFKFGLIALILFITTPIILIHSHLALDNIMPIPFILLWLFGIKLFEEKRSFKYLILSGISLGISFYAHKSMRSAALVWTILTCFYLVLQTKDWKFNLKKLKPIIFFLISILPFYLISPILDYKYAGAVYGNQSLVINSIYDFIYFYISSFDLSFLFITGDINLHHSTGKHGMFLLSTSPFFIYGIYKSIVLKNKFFIFLIICFFSGPLLLGFIGSVHRASRMLFLVPLFILITGLGFSELVKMKNKFIKAGVMILSLLFILNFFDFAGYYFFRYADDTYNIFYSTEGAYAYKKLDEISKKENLKPLVDSSILNIQGDAGSVDDFSRSLYFVNPETFTKVSDIPNNSVILTNNSKMENLEKIDQVSNYYLFIKKIK